MLIEEIKNIKSGKRELKKFGITMGVALGIVGCIFLLRGKNFYPYFFVFSILSFISGLIIPVVLKPVYKIWMIIATIIGWFMTRVILSILFYLVVTPIGILTRVLGKDFLNLKFDKKAKSYWIEVKDYSKRDKGYYERQF